MTASDVIEVLAVQDRPLSTEEVVRALGASGLLPNEWERVRAIEDAGREAERKGRRSDLAEAAAEAASSHPAILGRVGGHLSWLAKCGLAVEDSGLWSAVPEACKAATRRGRVEVPRRERKGGRVKGKVKLTVAGVPFDVGSTEADHPKEHVESTAPRFVWEWCYLLGDRPERRVHELRGCRAGCIAKQDEDAEEEAR